MAHFEGEGFDDDSFEDEEWDNVLEHLNQNFQIDVKQNYGSGQDYMINKVKVRFPYEAYKSQKQLMAKIIEGVHDVKNCLLESPTGTGKTAAILCALLGWQDYCRTKKLTQIDFAKIASEQAGNCICGFMTNPENLRGSIVIVEEKTASLSKKYSLKANIAVPDDNYCSQEISQSPSPRKSMKIEVEAQAREEIMTISKAKDDLCRYCVMKNFSKKQVPTIYYATRTHSQIKQVIDQLKNTPYKLVRMSILSSRQLGCINENVKQGLHEREEEKALALEENKDKKSNKKKTKKALDNEKKENLDEACRVLRRGFFYNNFIENLENSDDLERKRVCDYFDLPKDLIESAQEISSRGAWDIEDMIKFGQDKCICPYYTGQALAADNAGGVRIVFCPYNYLICPEIRNSVGVNLTGNIVVFDEAHNIESISRDVASCSIDSERLDVTVRQTLDNILNSSTNKEVGKVKAVEYFSNLLQKLSTWMKKNAPKPNIESIYGTPTRSNDPPHKILKGKEVLEALDFIGLSKEEQSRNWDMYQILTSKKESSEESKEGKTKGKEKTATTENPNDNPQSIDNNPNIAQTSNSAKEDEDFKVPVIVTRSICEMLRSLEFLHQEANLEHYRVVLENKGKPRQEKKEKQPALFSSLGLISSTQQQQQQEDNEKKDELSVCNILLHICCMNPGIAFKSIRDNAHSIIVTSGTLSPMDSFSGELDTSFPVQLKAQHVIQDCQTLTGVIKYASISQKELKLNKAAQNDVSTMDELGFIILQICQKIPFGVLVFLPSYGFMTALKHRWTEYPLGNPLLKRLGDVKHIFYEEQIDKAKFEKEMQQYKRLIDEPNPNKPQTGCILFAIFRGKVSEGINFSDNQARAVIPLGIPYSSLGSHSVVCKKSYNDEIRRKPGCGHHLTGSQWYNIQAFRAINQAFGRCIRHKNDWGAIILLESRFVSKHYQEQLSGWVTKNNLTVYEKFNNLMPHLVNFVKQRLEFESQVGLSPKPSTSRSIPPRRSSNPCRRLDFNELEEFEDENDELETQILTADNMDLDSSAYSLDESDCVDVPRINGQKVHDMSTQIITRASSTSSSDDMDISYHSSD